MKLYIANQNYSTWSLRAWVIFERFNLNAEVMKLSLFTPEFYQTLSEINPAAKVPALVDGDIKVWDSLAILEYVNDNYLNGAAWPTDKAQKAKARAISCEMHSGFMNVRNELPMNCRALRKITLSEGAAKEWARIDDIWSEQMAAFPNGWLFGEWSIADAMFTPVVMRAKTYNLPLSDLANQYKERVLDSQEISTWLAQAGEETDIVKEDEAGEPI
ncbi:glutathione S-transferase family protein [Agaribacter flavus]|uniref:Glutathione S-transferase family protein n=1 Tax=Agaribacter flavus TaxID=1902781 RepID=A0ABV7FKB1_9ALTE